MALAGVRRLPRSPEGVSGRTLRALVRDPDGLKQCKKKFSMGVSNRTITPLASILPIHVAIASGIPMVLTA
jgi:hypothetical protein